MEKELKNIKCPLCGCLHLVEYYDPTDGYMGHGLGWYYINCDNKNIRISAKKKEYLINLGGK